MSIFGSTAPEAVKFEKPGDTVTGVIAEPPIERQVYKFGTQELDFWADGSPKMQIIVTLKDCKKEYMTDTGERTLYVASSRMKKAINAVLKANKIRDVEVGGALTVTYTGVDPESKNPANPAKAYTASYVPPASPLATQQSVPEATAVSTPAPAVSPSLTSEQIAKVTQMRELGVTDDAICGSLQITSVQLAEILPF